MARMRTWPGLDTAPHSFKYDIALSRMALLPFMATFVRFDDRRSRMRAAATAPSNADIFRGCGSLLGKTTAEPQHGLRHHQHTKGVGAKARVGGIAHLSPDMMDDGRSHGYELHTRIHTAYQRLCSISVSGCPSHRASISCKNHPRLIKQTRLGEANSCNDMRRWLVILVSMVLGYVP